MLNFRSIIILIAFYLSAAYTVYWGLTENFGYIRIISSKPLDIEINNEKIVCDGFPCRIKIKPNLYDIVMSSEGDYKRQFKVNAKRGRLAKIEYVPRKNISAKQVEFNDLSPIFTSETSANSTSVFYNNRLIHRFNLPVDDVNYTVTSDLKEALVYSPTLQQVFRIDLKRAVSKVEKLTEEFEKLNLLDSETLIIENKNGVFKQKNKIISPSIFLASAILTYDQDSELIISSNDYNLSGSNKPSFDSILENIDEYKQDLFLYLYNSDTKEYNKLLTLKEMSPDDLVLSRQFLKGEIKSVLQTKTKSFIIDSN